MRILHYIPSIDVSSGGVGAYMQLLTRDLGKLCELHVLTHQSDNMLELENCTIHFIQYKWLPWNNCKKEFVSLLNELKPDVFHSNCCWMPVSALTAMWAKALNYKVVYSPHGMLEPWIMQRNYWIKKLPAILLFQKHGIVCANLLHATAESEKENIIKLGWNNNVKVIGNCVQIDKIPMKENWEKKNNILFLSRIHEKKGINFLIEAVAELKVELKDYTVSITGPGEESYLKELKALADRLGVNDKIKFLDPVFGEERYRLYRKADLFVLPTHSENFGIVVTEALASGTPVITTKGAPWEDLEVYGCGWWTEVGTQPLVNALKHFLTCTSKELQEKGFNGRKLVEYKYSSIAISKEFFSMYKSLTK